jgi:hypothetical protein
LSRCAFIAAFTAVIWIAFEVYADTDAILQGTWTRADAVDAEFSSCTNFATSSAIIGVDLSIYALVVADGLVGRTVDDAEAISADLAGFTGFIASAAVLWIELCIYAFIVANTLSGWAVDRA